MPVRRATVACVALDDEPHRKPPDLTHRLTHCRQRWIDERGDGNVVVPDDRYVLRHTSPLLPEMRDRTERKQIALREYRGEALSTFDEPGRGLLATRQPPVLAGGDECRGLGERRATQSLAVALQARLRRRPLEWSGHGRDQPMATFDQHVRGVEPALPVI